MKDKNYLVYALGEISLIVVGVLLALFINNENQNRQYENQVDANFQRVYDDLNRNIKQARETIFLLRKKDSLINLVMLDSLTKDDYYANLDIPYLTVQNVQEPFDRKSITNLIQMDVLGSKYKKELLSELIEIQLLMKRVNSEERIMGDFIREKSMPLLAENIESFGDLTYNRTIKDDALDYFLNSKQYKSLVAQYAIYAVRLQLDANRRFYKKALEVRSKIGEDYNLVDSEKIVLEQSVLNSWQGKFIREDYPDTLEVKNVKDSLLIGREKEGFVYLVPLENGHYFLDGKGQKRYFISFYKNEQSNMTMKLHLFSDRFNYLQENKSQ